MIYFSFIFLAALTWGTTGIFIKLMSLPLVSTIFLRTLVPTLFSAFFILKQKQSLIFNKRRYYFISILSLCNFIFLFKAYQLAPVPLVSIMYYCWPLCHYFLNLIFKKDLFIPTKFCIACVALLGVFIIHFNSSIYLLPQQYVGLLLGFLAALSTAILLLLVKHHTNGESIFKMIYIYNSISALLLFPVAVPAIALVPASKIVLGLLFGLLVGFLSFYFYFRSLTQLSSTTLALFSYLELPSALFFSFIFLAEKITFETVLGATIIILSSMMMFIFEKKQWTIITR